MITLNDILKNHYPPSEDEYDVKYNDFVKFFWKYKGLLKEVQRNNAFWSATNENLKIAYEKLDQQEKELDKLYSTIQEDLQVARQIQSSLLPPVLEKMDKELDLAIFHNQLNEVGGDYYDFFKTKDGNYAIGLFDIAGHGISAALIMTYLKAQLMSAMEQYESPKDIVDCVNSHSFDFLRNIKKYATVNLILFTGNTIKYVCGGGNGLLLHKEGTVEFNKKDSFIGLRNRPFREYELPFEPGNVLVLYTDGISEARNEKGESYSKKRLNELLKKNFHLDVRSLLNTCIEDLHRGNYDTHDDISLLILQKKD